MIQKIDLQSSLFQGENLFNLWWLFFNEDYTTKIGMEINCLKFSGKLMSYLKTINSVLQDLTISYNCLNKPDFIVILGHLKHLKHLTVFAAVGTEKNILEDISNSKCQLQVNLCQKLLFLHQLTHNMTTDCSLNYKFVT